MKRMRIPSFTVALVGADGAGKTTIARRLQREGQLPIKYLYMGVSRSASNRMLPTTWLLWRLRKLLGRAPQEGGPPDPARRSRPRDRHRGLLRRLKEGLYVANLLAEEWFRQLLVYYYLLRGYVVLFDRHFFVDYYAHDIAPENDDRPLLRRIHGFLLERLFPRPDLVVLLDAPADVLFARKREGTVELVERRRREYWRLENEVPHFITVDATQSEDDVAQTVLSLIRAHGERLSSGVQTAPDGTPSHDEAAPASDMKS